MVPQREPVSPAELAKQGVKARDFAYESTLPPIRSTLFHQVQPGRFTNKRVRDSLSDDSDTDGPNAKRAKALSRVPTEIYDEETSQPTAPSRGLISHRPELRSTIPLATQPQTPPRRGVTTPHHTPSTPQFESQNSEIDTPLVTPSGSFQLEHDYSPVDIASTSQPDSQFTPIQDAHVSYSQLGFTPVTSQVDDSQPTTVASLSPSRLARPHLSIMSKSVARLTRRTSSLIRRTSASILSSAPRYYLRARKTITYFVKSKPRTHTRGSPNIKRTVRKPGKA